jgi:hypothetical protein
MKKLRMRSVLVAAGGLSLACPRDAFADEKTECAAAHANGQELRARSAWQQAQKRFQFCARSTCPAVVVADCVRWYDELSVAMPHVIVAAKAPDGRDTAEAALLIDGTRVSDRLSATAIPVDPGEHVFRLEHPGWAPLEQRVLAREGDKQQRVMLRFAPPERVEAERRSPMLGIVLVSLGVVGAAVAVPVGISAKSRQNGLDNTCGTTGSCAPSQVGPIERDYWIAGIVGGIGVVALGLGIWQLVSRGGDPPPVGFSPGGLRVAF